MSSNQAMAGSVAELSWHNCYEDSWQGYITNESFVHPAKFARGLITQIIRFMLAEGMVKRGDVIVDPFGGIGTGGIIAASHGLQWYGCELEPKFHALAQANFALHMHTWMQFDDPAPVLVNGDSRKLRENLRAQLVDAVACSPPYEGLGANTKGHGIVGAAGSIGNGCAADTSDYGTTPGQLGAMKPGDVGAVVSSPPYTGSQQVDDREKPASAMSSTWRKRQGGITVGSADGQLATLPPGDISAVVSSPPYAESLRGDNTARETAEESRAKRVTEGGSLGQSCRHNGYGGAGNLGNLEAGSVDAVATSPPFRDPNAGKRNNLEEIAAGKLPALGLVNANDYADMTTGNIAAANDETFWSAAKTIVQECHAILKPGGWSAWVVKDFIRNKQRVPFCDDWCKLLESCGFVVTHRARAWLVKKRVDKDLFGGDDHVKTTARKSFFRRLYESKYPANSIDWEEVVFARKPLFPDQPERAAIGGSH